MTYFLRDHLVIQKEIFSTEAITQELWEELLVQNFACNLNLGKFAKTFQQNIYNFEQVYASV